MVMTNPWYGVLMLVICYLIGNLDFGYIIVKAVKGVDIRDYGSGNAGMTNVLRTQGGALAAWVFLGDALKGVICILGTRMLGFTDWWIAGAGMAVVAGHNWPVFLGFRGGKGVATTIGVFFAYDPFCAIISFVVGLVVLLTTKTMSLGSMTGIVSAPIVCLILYGISNPPELVLALFLAVSVVFQHRSNIKRLKEGTESKLNIGIGKKS